MQPGPKDRAYGRLPPRKIGLQGRLARKIELLDPQRNCREIVYLLTAYGFPWDIERALEFALFRTYAVPSISGLLYKTREFIRRPRKRYDDTELILAEILENGFDSRRGQAALGRLNEMHGRLPIGNEDFLYVLSTLIYEPLRWLERFGWRPLTEREKRAWFHYHCELGRRMHIGRIPTDFDDFERFNVAYEHAHFRYAVSNHRIGSITRDLLLGFYVPRFLLPLVRPAAHALMDPPLLQAMGFPEPPGFLRRLAIGALHGRARLLRWLPERRRSHLLTQVWRPTYPEGYEVEALGTFRTWARPRPSANDPYRRVSD